MTRYIIEDTRLQEWQYDQFTSIDDFIYQVNNWLSHGRDCRMRRVFFVDDEAIKEEFRLEEEDLNYLEDEEEKEELKEPSLKL